MSGSTFLDSIDIWVLYPLTFLWALLAFELGYRYGVFRQKKSQVDTEPALDAMVGATLGLLAFLLAFMVSMATSRFDNRRQLVVDEATAIHTAYLQAGYLVEPYPSEIRTLLSEYVDLRLDFTGAAEDVNRLQEIASRSEAIHAKLWSLAEAVVKETPARDEVSLFIASLNEVINVHTRRAAAALSSRLPATILLGMYLVAALSMMIVGYHNSYAGKRNLFSILVMITIFTVVMLLIVDLDRPQEGLLRVSQQALIDLQRQLGVSKP